MGVIAGLLESGMGIDMSDPNAVVLTITDGISTYTRPLMHQNSATTPIVQVAPVKGNGNAANELWVVYYRSAETALSNLWPFGSQVTVSVMAKDVGASGASVTETGVTSGGESRLEKLGCFITSIMK